MSLVEEFDVPGKRAKEYTQLPTHGLGQIVLYRLSQYGEAWTSDTAAELNHDAYRLTSWVDEEDSLFGYALAIDEPNDMEKPFVSSLLYKVNREAREILPEYPKSIEVPRLISGIADLKSEEVRSWVSDALLDLDRDELEVSIQMIGKAAQVFHSHRLPALDRYVYLALAEPKADELSRRFPGRNEAVIPEGSAPEHILEWHDFIELAHKRMDREFSATEEPQEIFLEHEIGTKHYVVNVYRRDGKLISLQFLSYNRGAWQGQFIEPQLDKDDEDDFVVGQVSPVWDRHEILRVITEGSPMNEDIYEAYVQEAARSLGQANNFALSNVVRLVNPE